MLNERIIIQKPPADAGRLQQQGAPWADVGVFWASIRHLGGLETLRANSDVSVLRASVRMYYVPEIDATMRVVHGGVTYGISSPPLRNADKRFMDLVCEAVK